MKQPTLKELNHIISRLDLKSCIHVRFIHKWLERKSILRTGGCDFTAEVRKILGIKYYVVLHKDRIIWLTRL